MTRVATQLCAWALVGLLMPAVAATAEELTIRWAPIPATPQEGYFDDDTPGGKLLFAGGYGAGKTMTLVGKALKLSAINAPLPGIFTVPDFGHVIDTIIPTLEDRDPDTGDAWFLEPDQFHYHQTHHILTWVGGGPIHFASGEDPRSIKGPNFAFGLVDEPGIQPYAAWRNTVNRVRNVRATLRQVAAAGTPEGLGWLMDQFGEDERADYHVYTMATQENSELLRFVPDYIKQVMENATEAELASYLGGKFTNLTGALAYPTFDRDTHWRTGVAIDASLPLRVAFDFNVDPMACVIGQQAPGPFGPEARVVDAVVLYASTVMETCAEIAKRYPAWAPGLVIYGDATGKARSTVSLKSNYDIIRELLAPIGPLTMKVPTANPPVTRRLNSVNTMLKNALGQIRLVIRKTEPSRICTTRELIRSLQQTVKKSGTDDIEKKAGETVTHAGEALGYWIDAEFPAGRPVVKAGSTRVEWLL
jgi:hypothetical protein